MAEFVELEEIDGVRMSWNVWPYSRLEVSSKDLLTSQAGVLATQRP